MDIPVIPQKKELHKLKYPRTLNIDFRKLSHNALVKLADSLSIESTENLNFDELAVCVAKKFESTTVTETEVVDKFAAQFCRSNAEISKTRKRARSNREILDSEPARVGEQVAAKILQTNENGSWILGNIVSVDDNSYEVQDEDDVTRTVILPYQDVRRLEDSASHLRRGDNVLAVFPETTSFYRGIVVKNPKSPTHTSGSWEVIIRFEDDEDETGKAPARRVPARFVLRRSDVEPDNDEDDDDNDQ